MRPIRPADVLHVDGTSHSWGASLTVRHGDEVVGTWEGDGPVSDITTAAGRWVMRHVARDGRFHVEGTRAADAPVARWVRSGALRRRLHIELADGRRLPVTTTPAPAATVVAGPAGEALLTLLRDGAEWFPATVAVGPGTLEEPALSHALFMLIAG